MSMYLNDDPDKVEGEVPGTSNDGPEGNGNNNNQNGGQKQSFGQKMLEKRKEKAKKKLEKEAVKNAKKMALKGALSHIMMYAFAIIVVLIIIIGIIMFLVTMPGMVMEKLKAIFKAVGNYVAAFFGADTTEQIDDTEIFETLDYLEQMGYDLKGEGFLSGYETLDSLETLTNELPDGSYKLDKDVGVIRNTEDDTIAQAQSDFIFTYIMSDNYVYTIKNKNLVTQEPDGGFWDRVVGGVKAARYKIARFFTAGTIWDSLGVQNAVVDSWGKGMLVFYKEEGGIIGDRGNVAETDPTLFQWDAIKIDTESKKLSIKRKTNLFNNNNAMEFSLDGWTGRYGMPLEFLLSVHKATGMPDLAVDMVNSFPTEIDIILHKTSGKAITAYKGDKGFIEAATLNEALTGWEGKNVFSQVLSWFDNLVETEKEAQIAFSLGIDHAPTCSCETGEVEGYTITADDGTVTVVYKYEDGNFYKEQTGGTEPVDADLVTTNTEVQYTDVCNDCEEYVGKVVDRLVENVDYKFQAYTPYISKVTDHWYRDVYFVIDSTTKSSLGKEFVQYDYDYEALMKERWTLYETYTANPDDGYKYDETGEKIGKFILFVIDEDGSFKKDENGEYVLFDGEVEDARPSVLYEYNKDTDKYDPYEGNYNNTDGKDLYRLSSDGEYEKYTGTVAVAKKAVALDITKDENLEDLGWNNKQDTSIWTAYDIEDTTSGYEPLYTEEEIAEETDETVKKIMEKCYINLNLNGNLVQVGEGLRTETNYEIKKMFLQNNYFKYDGSRDSAEIITALREEVYKQRLDDDDKNNDYEYGPLTDEEREITIDNPDSDDPDDVYLVKDYSGNVMLNQDSLNAFSMLENTHTLDADYIYRDFKELIVELGYFEKEELTDETPRLLQFPIPEIGSGGYPKRIIDKRDNEFGTMVHSKYDIETIDLYSLMATYQKAAEEKASGKVDENIETGTTQEVEPVANATSSTATINNTLTSNNRIGLAQNFNNNVNIARTVGAMGSDFKRISESGDGYDYKVKTGSVEYTHFYQFKGSYAEEKFYWSGAEKTIHRAACGPTSCVNILTGYGHDVNPTNDIIGIRFDATIDGVKNFMESYGVTGESYSGLSDTEYVSKIKEAFSQGRPIITLMHQSKTGDSFWTSDGHFVPMVGQDTNGNIITLDPGSSDAARHTYTGGVEGLMSCLVAVWIADEPPSGMNVGANYEGFLGNEAVVSPVTGILLEYGTYDKEKDIDSISKEPYRVNVDLKYGTPITAEDLEKDESGQTSTDNTNATNAQGNDNTSGSTNEELPSDSRIVSDQVGYARILVLNKDYYEKLEKLTDTKWKNSNDKQGLLTDAGIYTDEVLDEEDLENIMNGSNPELTESVYGYKEFAERYEMAGIAGYVLYIDGFKTELPDEEFVTEEEESDDDTAITTTSKEKPEGTPLTIDSFKVQPSKITEENENIISLYEEPEAYKVASEKATIKLEIEEQIKTETTPAITINDLKEGDLIFIKEGTVIGRTYTDKEIVEDLRNEKMEDYIVEENTDSTTTTTTTDDDSNADEEKNKLIGNYLRVQMFTNLESEEVIEDVENYMKLDELEEEDVVDFSILGTVLSRDEWVEMAYEYASNHGADSVFTNKDNLGKMYDICVEHGVNPEYIFVRGIQESGLNSPNGNYWGYATPNGADLADLGSWDTVLTLYCETINEYQDPSTWQYDTIMERYEERKNCTENGGIDSLGFGKPDTIGGQQSLYSWLGDDHSGNSSGDGGMYYLYPWGWAGNQYEGENKIIFESKQEFEQLCGSQHDTSGGKTSNVATTVWEQGMYTAYQNRMIVDLAKGIFGERAGTYR